MGGKKQLKKRMSCHFLRAGSSMLRAVDRRAVPLSLAAFAGASHRSSCAAQCQAAPHSAGSAIDRGSEAVVASVAAATTKVQVPSVEGRVLAASYSRWISCVWDGIWAFVRVTAWNAVAFAIGSVDAVFGRDSSEFRSFVRHAATVCGVLHEIYFDTVAFVRDDSATGGPAAGQTFGMQRAKTQWVDAEGAPIVSFGVAICAAFERPLHALPPFNMLYLGVQVASQSQQSLLQRLLGVYCVEVVARDERRK